MKRRAKKHGGARPGAGRPKGNDRESVNVSLLPHTLKRIDTEAFERTCSRGEVIERWETIINEK